MEKSVTLIGRILLGHMFLLAGISKISAYAGTQGYMESMGVPGALLPLVILLEIGGGLAVIVGWFTRWAAIVLAVFTALSALIFHTNFGDQTQMIMFMKNWTIVGGFMYLAAFGPGPLSVDAKRGGSI